MLNSVMSAGTKEDGRDADEEIKIRPWFYKCCCYMPFFFVNLMLLFF